MSYQVLALKYRPQTFTDVIGQTHVTVTLANAISNDMVAHALLFSGPRGTGKTTTARIFAKAMNCDKGPTPAPCNNCRHCREITAGNSSDVFEIDGASNNSVDQIRELKENVAYMPASARYKIYIIDEVHMLSTAAFNALLKTLEEPPAHILFVFATTEPHKIPATILSRCQRHDLGRIAVNDIADNLMALCQKEGYDIPEKTAEVIARQADGSIRDSLSLLDRIFSASVSSRIDHESVLETIGITDKRLLFDMSEAVISSDGARIIEVIERITESGLDYKQFYHDIIAHFRNLVVLKICGLKGRPQDIPAPDAEKGTALISGVSGTYLSRLLQVLLTEEHIIRSASHPKTALEMVFLKLLQLKDAVAIDEIISKLDLVSQQIDRIKTAGNTSAPSAGTSGAGSPSAPPAERAAGGREVPSGDVSPSYEVHEKRDWPDKKADAAEAAEAPPGTLWQRILKKIERSYPTLSAILSRGTLKDISDGCIMVNLNDCTPFELSRVRSKKREIERLCSSFFDDAMTVDIESNDDIKQTPPNAPHRNGRTAVKTSAQKQQEALSHPVVAAAVKIFNGAVVDAN